MQLRSICAIDLHHSHCTVEAQTLAGNKVLVHRDVPTERQALVEAVKAAPGPKVVILEEGPMADWVLRVLEPYGQVVVCDPRRNRLLADGDKTDDIDPGKLIELYRNQSLRAVHHPAKQSVVDLRASLWLYHDQVELVTAAKNKLKAAFRSLGLQYGEGDLYSLKEREGWLGKLPARSLVRARIQELYGNLDELRARRDRMHERVCRLADRHALIRRFMQIPGYGPIRALTFWLIVDTPYRFRSPQKLWQYAGLGLRRQQSGDPNRERKLPPVQYNLRLKAVARGAMEMAIGLDDGNPFEQMYRRLLRQGLREGLARVSVARKILAVPWGMWKSNSEYDPALVS
jgi:transposase